MQDIDVIRGFEKCGSKCKFDTLPLGKDYDLSCKTWKAYKLNEA